MSAAQYRQMAEMMAANVAKKAGAMPSYEALMLYLDLLQEQVGHTTALVCAAIVWRDCDTVTDPALKAFLMHCMCLLPGCRSCLLRCLAQERRPNIDWLEPQPDRIDELSSPPV